jgi:hypothetical protein
VSVRRALALGAVALLTPVVLAGCGGSEVEPKDAAGSDSPTPSAGATVTPGDLDLPPGVKLEKPKARETITPTETLSSVPEASELPVSGPDAPRTIQGFPVPKGAKVKDPGPIEETWQFDIRTKDPDEVLAFYRSVLPRMGWTVRTDVTYTLGYEQVRWDIVFDGKVSGSMVADPDDGTVFVVVNPPGQPAFAGDG